MPAPYVFATVAQANGKSKRPLPTPTTMNPTYKRPLTLLAVLLIGSLPMVAQAQRTPNYFRPHDQRGLAMFEAPFVDPAPYEGFRVYWGGAFTQQFQMVEHENEAQEVIRDGQNVNELIDIGAGFNLATANLNLNAQLAEGVRVNLITYLSSRHHTEAWVKGGYLQVDEVGFLGSETLDRLFRFVRVRAGHFEINYGDAHFRRTDNGNAIWNPFVGNYIMDSFTTEIGAEVYAFTGDLFAMGAVTGGEIRGSVTRPDDRAPSYYAKVGFDRNVSDDLRLRLSGSVYTTTKSVNNTLYAGDRAGSRYYLVLEPTGASEATHFRSGRVNPVLTDHLTAVQINPFLKFRGLELFGLIETASGGVDDEAGDRTFNQYAVEAIYRFLPREQLYVGTRYNVVTGTLVGSRAEIDVSRLQVGAGWFPTPNILLKAEYVTQRYDGYPSTDILHGGAFDGVMIEGVIAF